MSSAANLPVWLAIVIAFAVLMGAFFTMMGCLGLLRMKTFYQRIHTPTLGTSFGCIGILVASAIYFTATDQRLVVHEVLIFLFVSITTPITLMLLARAALHRDRVEGNGVPARQEMERAE